MSQQRKTQKPLPEPRAATRRLRAINPGTPLLSHILLQSIGSQSWRTTAKPASAGEQVSAAAGEAALRTEVSRHGAAPRTPAGTTAEAESARRKACRSHAGPGISAAFRAGDAFCTTTCCATSQTLTLWVSKFWISTLDVVKCCGFRPEDRGPSEARVREIPWASGQMHPLRASSAILERFRSCCIQQAKAVEPRFSAASSRSFLKLSRVLTRRQILQYRAFSVCGEGRVPMIRRPAS